MRDRINRTLLFHLFESFLTTWALMKAARMEPGNILTFVFFLLVFFFYRHVSKRLSRLNLFLLDHAEIENCVIDDSIIHSPKTNLVSLVTAMLFTTLYMLVDYPQYIELLTNGMFRFSIILITFTGFTILFYYLLKFLFSYTCNINRLREILYTCYQDVPYIFSCRYHRLSVIITYVINLYRNHTAGVSFFICLLCWLPYYLYQYPGIMTPDSINQFEQVLGVIPYSNHHPWVHTLVFKLCYETGYFLTHNMVIAVSCYTLFQMCLLAGSAAYFINTLRRRKVRPFVLLLITAFYALIPYHAVFSVTIWKDIPFAAAVMLFSCAMFRMMDKEIRWQDLLVFIISGVMICLFRSNGWYAFLFCCPFLLFYYRGNMKKLYPAILGIVSIALVVKYPVMNACLVEQPDFIESVCIPMQQITAVICNDRELTPEQLALVENVVDLTYIKDLYNPTFADNIKELVRAGNQDYLIAHKGEFFKLWLELGMKYPGDYLTAYVKQTYGYWYPDSFYLVAEAEGVSATDLGVSHMPLIGGPLVIKTKEIAIKLGSMVPIYGTLWSMGVACWVMLFSIGSVIIRKEYKKLICYLPNVALLLTVLIATPVATEFRYVYFMVFSLPFFLTVAMVSEDSRSSMKRRQHESQAL